MKNKSKSTTKEERLKAFGKWRCRDCGTEFPKDPIACDYCGSFDVKFKWF